MNRMLRISKSKGGQIRLTCDRHSKTAMVKFVDIRVPESYAKFFDIEISRDVCPWRRPGTLPSALLSCIHARSQSRPWENRKWSPSKNAGWERFSGGYVNRPSTTVRKDAAEGWAEAAFTAGDANGCDATVLSRCMPLIGHYSRCKCNRCTTLARPRLGVYRGMSAWPTEHSMEVRASPYRSPSFFPLELGSYLQMLSNCVQSLQTSTFRICSTLLLGLIHLVTNIQ